MLFLAGIATFTGEKKVKKEEKKGEKKERM